VRLGYNRYGLFFRRRALPPDRGVADGRRPGRWQSDQPDDIVRL